MLEQVRTDSTATADCKKQGTTRHSGHFYQRKKSALGVWGILILQYAAGTTSQAHVLP